MTTEKWVVVCVLIIVLSICIWEIVKICIASCIEGIEAEKEKKRRQEERRREEEQEEKEQRKELISKIGIAIEKGTENIAQILEQLLKEDSHQSGYDNANYSDTDIDDSKTSS